MQKHHSNYIKKLLLPCLSFSVTVGVLSTILVTLFKLETEKVIHFSQWAYTAASQKPIIVIWFFLGIAVAGLASSFILSHSRTSRGGGIPTSIAAIRGITNFKWLPSLVVLPVTALLSFLCGLPLGTEGPCVQMGTAVGDGTVRLFGGKKNKAWRRYIMTGGATAGFALATGAPITSIVFAGEELHKRFSPLLFSVSALSVLVSQICATFLESFGIGTVSLFNVYHFESLPLHLLFVPLTVGFLCGIASLIFTKIYHKFDKLMQVTMKNISIKFKFPVIFVLVALIGFFVPKALGTGHSLIENMFSSSTVWYMLIFVFLIRAAFMMLANTAGITGGIFLPTLAFGAIIGALCGNIFVAMNVIDEKYYALLIVLGMTAFLGATSKIPITACVFAIEALGGIHNILGVIIAATASFIVVEISGLNDFTDTVVETKAHSAHKGKQPHVIEVPLTVKENSFVIGKELQDVLWPVSCVVLSIEKSDRDNSKTGILQGDVLTVHYKTYDPVATAEEFEVLVGDQSEDIDRIMRPES